MALAPMVHQCIAGAAVKTLHLALRAEHAEVGHAAQVEHRRGLSRAGKHALVEGGHQGCALAPSSHVAAAQVGHHGDAAEFGQQRRAVELEGVASAVELLRPVAHGLAMGADGPHGRSGHAAVLQQSMDHPGIGACQCIARQGCAVQLVGARGVEGE